MANRRLIAKSVLYSDLFSTLPDRVAKLYIYMILEADDDGFIGHIRQVIIMAEADYGALEKLIKNGLVIQFKSGVCVISHWRIHNIIDRSGYNPTEYTAERAQLYLSDQGIYFLK